MARITFIAADGAERAIAAEPGLSLMEAAVRNGIDGIEAVCGGNCYCGTCRVLVPGEWRAIIGPPGEFEAPVLEAAGDDTPGWRLSCQVPVSEALDGLAVRLPASQT
jgi:ferredoxin, 2Fe-2S